ncbi:MAG: hypothetical protein L3K26_02265 [Candidatus Hydrogenedentes bacterium]|nr:hypothetical protein [Candidatus Hydrogenedentota bacterium]
MKRIGLVLITCAVLMVSVASGQEPSHSSTVSRIEWQHDKLTIYAGSIPEGKVQIWYLEAFCRTGSTDRVWSETVIPHETKLIKKDETGQSIALESHVEPGVVVHHEIRVVKDGVSFSLHLKNTTDKPVDIDWAQPCIRVGKVTGLDQENYHKRCFIFTDIGQVMLDKLPRNEEARYKGGQIYVPDGINLDDVNPRPLSPVKPANKLIGCVTEDGKWLLATAWEPTQELFQGVIRCMHADFRIGGLKAGESKTITGKVYLLPNDVDALLAAYKADFE